MIRSFCVAVVWSMSACAHGHHASDASAPFDGQGFVVELPSGDEYQPLLSGPPGTVGFHAGRVVLAPGETGEVHSTEIYEEVLIILEGNGQAVIGGQPLPMRQGSLVYIPPHTEHFTENTGTARLAYVYLVAPTE